MRPWTDYENKVLLMGVGAYSLDWLSRKLGRTPAAVQAQIARQFGHGGLTRGSYTLRGAMRETGYACSQLRRAQKALNQRWPRTSTRGSFLISAEQLEDIVAWLGGDYWCRRLRLYACRDCATRDKQHFAGGLCVACAFRARRTAKKLGLPTSVSGMLAFVGCPRTSAPDYLAHASARLSLGYMLHHAELTTLWEALHADRTGA